MSDVLDEWRQRMCCAQSNEEVNVVCGPPEGLWNTADGSCQTARVFVQSRPPGIGNAGAAVFSAKNNMIMEA